MSQFLFYSRGDHSSTHWAYIACEKMFLNALKVKIMAAKSFDSPFPEHRIETNCAIFRFRTKFHNISKPNFIQTNSRLVFNIWCSLNERSIVLLVKFSHLSLTELFICYYADYDKSEPGELPNVEYYYYRGWPIKSTFWIKDHQKRI